MTPKQRREVADRYLASIPREVADEHVRMNTWISRRGVNDASNLMHCGMTACAAGWLCMVPPLREEGLHFSDYAYRPTFENSYGFFALCSFFGIVSYDVTVNIFTTPDIQGYKALQDVRRRLRAAPYAR